MDPPPDGLIVADRLIVDAAVTAVRESPDGPVLEQTALLLQVEGHLNGTEEPRSVKVIIDTASTARLTGALLDALDGMRAADHVRPE